MEDVSLEVIKQKSIKGILALTSRTFVLQVIAFGGTFLLTIFLSPAAFGVFYVVSAIIAFLNYFSDIGLAAALIQKKEAVTDRDLMTTFTIQQGLVVVLVILAFFLTSVIGKFYGLDGDGQWLYRSLIVAFFLSSLKTIPSVILERKLDFQKLVIPQIVETLGFYATAVVLAWQGLGTMSFAWAVLMRSVIGLVAIYIVSPWRPSLGIDRASARKLLRFGLPFQANSLLALVKDDLLTVMLGKILTFTEVGYIGWAKKWAEVPLRLIMDSVIRVTFPTFSRLQHEVGVLGRAIEKTLFGLAASIFPITAGLLFGIAPLVSIIPRYEKWEPALLSFYLFAVASAIASLSTPLTNALNAVGRIKITLILMVLWTSSTWILTMLLVNMFGFNGVALALLLITSTLVLVVYLARSICPFSFWHSVRFPILAVSVQLLWYFGSLHIIPKNIVATVIVGIGGVILYVGVLWRFERVRISSILEKFPLWRR
ncbi:MAG: Polysaccharide biosynthesis protein [Candidatus Curtissbacteria bacterium GW2011_GWA1_41_11]|uniref:Polysaccharide biosynthesis protein n=1 Tax=Candidatus Curtissbacteria bacterium GW2011_GWA1_41_11 TaxID=1618409 RepID=A0A0G0WRY4_9BACT|nr:MAG: Polysaccharide biosynthesis protein [Candidatus Curtissbacteria bacterium GW2011_GWA1_41_11]